MSQADDDPHDTGDPWFDDVIRRARELDEGEHRPGAPRLETSKRAAMLSAIGVEPRPTAKRRALGKTFATHAIAMTIAAGLTGWFFASVTRSPAPTQDAVGVPATYALELGGGRAGQLGPESTSPRYRIDDPIVLVARPGTAVEVDAAWTVDIQALPLDGGSVRSNPAVGTVGPTGVVAIETRVGDLVGDRAGTWVLEIAIGPRGTCELGEERPRCVRLVQSIVVSP